MRADPPIHITFKEPEGDSPLIGEIEKVILEWLPHINLDITEAEDCASEIVMLLQGWGTNGDDLLPPFVARHIRRRRNS